MILSRDDRVLKESTVALRLAALWLEIAVLRMV
jgi:hypothetical protein